MLKSLRGQKIILKMWQQLAVAVVIIVSSATGGQASGTPVDLLELCKKFSVLNSSIRDRTIKKSVAKEQFRQLTGAIRREYYAAGGNEYSPGSWVFPLKGYGYKAIGGVRGNGYQKGGYNYFAGNKHSGHPSHDIFIKDKYHVSLDDLSKKPVSVLSLSGGVVVAVESRWDISGSLRGGKYIWIYDPTADALIYYAHNSRLFVETGDLLKPGDIIAEVGRTGLNAHKRRSPTHLHLTYLAIVNGLPEPRNIYKELLRSELM